MSAKKILTPHQKILRAFTAHRGVRLSADDVDNLMRDDAIQKRAQLDEMGVDHEDDLP